MHNIVVSLILSVVPVAAVLAGNQPPSPPEPVRERIPALSLAGAGDYDVLWMDIYHAALWAPEGEFRGDRPYVLAIRYERDLDGRAIAGRSTDEIRKLGIGSAAQHEAWDAAMKALFPDVRDGDQLTGVHFPGEETVFWFNGERLGSVTDPEFGDAFFAIWLDENTSAPELRRELLGLNLRGATAASP